MIYAKHPQHGNAHFADTERERLTSEGWCIWPRTKDQKQALVTPAQIRPVSKFTDDDSGPATFNEIEQLPFDAEPEPEKTHVRAALVARAERAGVKVDGRWSDARIAKALKK